MIPYFHAVVGLFQVEKYGNSVLPLNKPVEQQLSTQIMTSQQQGRHCLSALFTSPQHLAQ